MSQRTPTIVLPLVLEYLRTRGSFRGGRCHRCNFWLDDETQTIDPQTGQLRGRQSNPGRGVLVTWDVMKNVLNAVCRGCRHVTEIKLEDLEARFDPSNSYRSPFTREKRLTCETCKQPYTLKQLLTSSDPALPSTQCPDCQQAAREFGDIVRVDSTVLGDS